MKQLNSLGTGGGSETRGRFLDLLAFLASATACEAGAMAGGVAGGLAAGGRGSVGGKGVGRLQSIALKGGV